VINPELNLAGYYHGKCSSEVSRSPYTVHRLYSVL
jgi:hypothetical protein